MCDTHVSRHVPGVSACICVQVHAHTWVWRPEVAIECLALSFHVTEALPLTIPRAHWLGLTQGSPSSIPQNRVDLEFSWIHSTKAMNANQLKPVCLWRALAGFRAWVPKLLVFLYLRYLPLGHPFKAARNALGSHWCEIRAVSSFWIPTGCSGIHLFCGDSLEAYHKARHCSQISALSPAPDSTGIVQ